MVLRSPFLMVRLVSLGIGFPTRPSMPWCLRPSRTLRAAKAVARRRAILDRRCARRHWLCAGRGGRMVPIEQKDGTRAAVDAMDFPLPLPARCRACGKRKRQPVVGAIDDDVHRHSGVGETISLVGFDEAARGSQDGQLLVEAGGAKATQ